jgi:uncharacterized damage-inducible protein DinB
MTRNISYATPVLLFGTLFVGAGAVSQDVTPTERDRAIRYLADTRDRLADAVKGLSDAQWKFKPAPDRWSVAEVVEHIAVVEELVVTNMLGKLDQAPAGAADRDPKQVDAIVLAKMPDRSTKVQAPQQIQPTGRWTPQGALDHFLASRVQTTQIAKSSPDLRGHVIAHPVFGPMDGYEWVLALAGHSERHTKQILEVKADPNFPQN